MAIPQSTTIAFPVAPVAETTAIASHLERLGQGGYRSVATIAERDAILPERRAEGMLVYVVAAGKIYQLTGTTYVPPDLGEDQPAKWTGGTWNELEIGGGFEPGIGEVRISSAPIVDSNWLLADGRVIDSATYPELVAKLETFTWRQNATGAGTSLTAVVWAGYRSMFVAVGGEQIYSSPDGDTWTLRLTAPGHTFGAIDWVAFQGYFIALSNVTEAGQIRGVIWYSSHGIDWTRATQNTSNSMVMVSHALSYAPTMPVSTYVSGGGEGPIGAGGPPHPTINSAQPDMMTGVPGTWQRRLYTSSGEMGYVKAIVWTQNQLVAVTEEGNGPLSIWGKIHTSSNGETWTRRTLTGSVPSENFTSLTHNFTLGRTVACAIFPPDPLAPPPSRTVFYVSSDGGTNWTRSDESIAGLIRSVCWDSVSHLYIAIGTIGTNGIVYTSIDGFTWIENYRTDAPRSFVSVAAAPELRRVVALVNNGVVFRTVPSLPNYNSIMKYSYIRAK